MTSGSCHQSEHTQLYVAKHREPQNGEQEARANAHNLLHSENHEMHEGTRSIKKCSRQSDDPNVKWIQPGESNFSKEPASRPLTKGCQRKKEKVHE